MVLTSFLTGKVKFAGVIFFILETVDQIKECLIDCEIKDEMVMLNNTHMSYQALCKAYELTGNNPLTNTPLDWSEVVRLSEVVDDKKLQP